MLVEERIKELGFELPAAPKPAGSYVPAKVSGNLVFTAGQLPLVDGVLMETGKLGQHLEAVHSGHHDIEYDDGGVLFFRELKALLAVYGGDYIIPF